MFTRSFRLSLLLLILLPAQALAAADLHQHIDQIMRSAYPADQPGAALIVVRNGEVVFRSSYGMANVELGVKVEPNMVFRLGSITKQFTAAAIMLLEERDTLSLDDPIEKFLPDYPTHGHNITVKHLLTHTSGIQSYTSIPGYMETRIRDDLETDELVDRFKDQPMNFAPGQRWLYNNSGYVLLGAIIEELSGMSYAEFIRTQIFDPLQMSHSHYGGHQLISKRVAGYGWAGDHFENAGYLSMTQPHAAGSLLSSIDDLARWDKALTSNELLSAESYGQMTTPFRLNSGEETDYGYGLFFAEIRGHATIGHGGGINGFTTYSVRIPEADVYVALLTNRSGPPPGPGLVAKRIAAVAIGDPYPTFTRVEVDPEVLKRYAGVYGIDENDTRILISVEGGTVFTQRTGGGRLTALPASETTFFYEDSLTYFEIVPGQGDIPNRMLLYPEGSAEAEEAVWVSAAVAARKEREVDPAIYAFYTGVYELQPGFRLTVTREGDRLMTQATGQAKIEIFPESRTRFFLKVVDAQLTFVWSSEGEVNEVILQQGGQEMRGRRIE